MDQKNRQKIKGIEIHLSIFSSCMVIVFILFDIFLEAKNGIEWSMVALELTIASFSLLSVALLFLRLIREKNDHQKVKVDLNTWKAKFESIYQENSQSIEKQLVVWDLSESEKDIALLLVKGVSLREIATLRNVKERTVRTQASAIYKKSNISNRNELAAYFLDDLIGQ